MAIDVPFVIFMFRIGRHKIVPVGYRHRLSWNGTDVWRTRHLRKL